MQGYKCFPVARSTCPQLFIGGKSDWGVYQNPGDLEKMQKTACTRMLGTHLVDWAGHWVQQEQPEEVSKLLLEFLHNNTHRENWDQWAF